MDAIGIKEKTLSRLEFEVLRECAVKYMLAQADLDGWSVDPDKCYSSVTRENALETVEELLSTPNQQINEDEPLTWGTFHRATRLMKLAEARDTLWKLYRGLMN